MNVWPIVNDKVKMNKRFQGRSEHRGRGGKKFFHNARKDFSVNDKAHFTEKSTFKRDHNQNPWSLSDPMNRLREEDVGITEYISEHEGFNGIIKQRYADFHVNEIDCDGNIVTLTDMNLPQIKVENSDGKPNADEHLKSLISPEMFEKIEKLVGEAEGSDSSVEIDVTEMTKDERRKLHNALQAIHGRLVSNTKQKEEKKFIVVSKYNSKAKADRGRAWPAAYGGDYVHFVLFKENCDTMETVNFIASRLRMKPNMITYAGTKDRRGVTSQKMSLWRVEPKTLANLNSSLRGVLLGNYSFETKGLKLGHLRGNRFRIVLRNVTGSDEQIVQAMTSLSEKGFINYYGLQRFGSSVAVPTHAVGKALLLGDWKLAVELILKPRAGEKNHHLAKARKIWWESRNPKSALEVLLRAHREKIIEGKLLLGLSLCAANDYVNALEKIPRNTRLLYLHAYQSLVWNKVVSRRIKELGLKPIPGDLIFVNDDTVDEDSEIPEVLEEEEEENKVSEPENVSARKKSVKVLSEEDVASVGIHDIVIPLPGHNVVYPENVMKDWYEDFLKSDGLSSATLKQNVRKYSVGGTYRKMVIRPDKLSWKTMRYSDPCKTLELSDKERMRNVECPKDEPDGCYKALILDFCLPSSTYATMALREVLKSDTSSEHQASLNDYHVEKSSSISENTSDKKAQEPLETSTSSECIETSACELSDSTSKNGESSLVTKVDERLKINKSVGEVSEVIDEKKVERSEEIRGDTENENSIQNEIVMKDENNTLSEECNLKKEESTIQHENKDEITESSSDEKGVENMRRKRELDDAEGEVQEKKLRLE